MADKTCECGWKINGDHDECYRCAREKARKEDRVCPKCDGFKKPGFPTCFKCKDKQE